MDLKLTLFYFFILFVCRMAKGHKEVSTSQAGRRRGTPREMAIARSLFAALSTEESRLYRKIPTEISLYMSDGATTTIVGKADNDVYFTREHFSAGLCLPIQSLVK